jgi:polar amino acid transport system substrate-binding protein
MKYTTYVIAWFSHAIQLMKIWITRTGRVMTISVVLSLFSISAQAADESVYERVIASGKIRCGYLIYPPAIIKDPNTGDLSGVFYDVVEEIGHKLSLEIEWAEEAEWSGFINDLKANRFDMMCGTAWQNASRGREANPIDPLYYSGVTTWARKDDTRFNKSVDMLNDPAYRIAVKDGTTTDFLAKSDFPKAQLLSLGDLAAYSDLAVAVNAKKADVTFLEQYVAQLYSVNNPNQIKQVSEPLRYYGNVMWVKKGQRDFEIMVNTAIEEILNTNFLETTFKKYDVPEGSYLMPAKPYEVKK